MAQADFFLKVDGADGESPDSKHSKEIEIDSFSWTIMNEGTSQRGGGAGAGKVSFGDFHFSKRIDTASPKLMQQCASGEHIPKVVLTCRKAGKDQQEYLKVTFSEGFVSSYAIGGNSSGSVIPADQMTVNFSKIEMIYKAQKADGTLGGGVTGSWSIKENKA